MEDNSKPLMHIQPHKEMQSHDAPVAATYVSPDNNVTVKCSYDKKATSIIIRGKKRTIYVNADTDIVWDVIVSQTGEWLTLNSNDCTVKIRTSQSTSRGTNSPLPVRSEQFNYDSTQVLPASRNKRFKSWSSNNYKKEKEYLGHTDIVPHEAIEPDETIIASCSNNENTYLGSHRRKSCP